MSPYLWGLLAGGLIVAGAGLSFALSLIMIAARERRAQGQPEQPVETIRCIACQRTIDWPATEPWPSACVHCKIPAAYTATRTIQSIAEAGIERQTERLRAELDDDAAVDAWLAGGTR